MNQAFYKHKIILIEPVAIIKSKAAEMNQK